MHVVVGCPVYRRAAQLRRWFEAVRKQKGLWELSVVIVGTKGDKEVEEVLQREKHEHSEDYEGGLFFIQHEWGEEGLDHNWTPERVEVVAKKRNVLLNASRQLEPDYFLSLDSDVLMPEDGLLKLIQCAEGIGSTCGAVSPKVWIWDGAVAAMTYEKGKLSCVSRRAKGLLPVDVLPSAACLVTSKLLLDEEVKYGVALEGKDYGWTDDERGRIEGWPASEMMYWSKLARAKGYKLFLLSGLTFKHEMEAPK